MRLESTRGFFRAGFLLITIGNITYTLCSFAITVLIGRKLGSEEFGIYALGVAISGLVWRFFMVGPTSILGREVARVPEKGILEFRRFLIFEFLSIPIGLLLTFVYSSLVGYAERIIALIVLISSAKVVEYLQDAIRYYSLGVMNEAAFGTSLLLRGISLLIAVSVPLYLGFNLEGIVLSQLGFNIILFLVLYHRFTPGFSFSLNFQNMKWMVSESLPLSFSGLLSVLFSRIDILMLSGMAGVREVGLYNAALALPLGMAIIPSSLASQMFPRLSNLYTNNKPESYKLIKRYIFVTVLFGLITSLTLFIVGGKVINFLFGKEYQEATLALMILGFGFIFRFATQITGTALTAMNLQRYSVPLYIIAIICNAIGNYLLIPPLSYVGCAISTSFSFLLLFSMSLIVICRAFRFKVMEGREIKESLKEISKP